MNKAILIGLSILMIITLGCTVEQTDDDRIRSEEEERFWKCQRGMFPVKEIEYDLIEYHNLSCDKIKFIVENWQSETVRERDWKSEGLLSGRKYIEKDYGVGSVKLTKHYSEKNRSEECGGGFAQSTTSIWLKQDFTNYYVTKCI